MQNYDWFWMHLADFSRKYFFVDFFWFEEEKSKGVKAGIEKAIDEQKKDKSAYNEGVKKGYTDAKKTETVTTPSSSKSESLTSGKTKKGGFSGGGVTSGAFK